jgi:uncharacterized protein
MNMKIIKVTALLLMCCHLSNAQTKNFIDQPYIEVRGTADTLITPDEIYIKILLSEKDTRDRVSLEDQEIKMVNALKSAGINTDTELSTNDMSSNFRIYILKNRDILKSKQYTLKVKDAVTATKVFMQLEELGISNASIERVDYSALDSIRNIMRSKAMTHARNRAVALTKPINQTVGIALHIEDNDLNTTNGMLQGRLAGVVVQGYGTDPFKSKLPKIEFEKIKVSSNVTVKFVLK